MFKYLGFSFVYIKIGMFFNSLAVISKKGIKWMFYYKNVFIIVLELLLLCNYDNFIIILDIYLGLVV